MACNFQSVFLPQGKLSRFGSILSMKVNLPLKAQPENDTQTMAPTMPSVTSKETLSSGGVMCPPMITTKSLTWRLLEAEERKVGSTGKFGKYGGRFVPETLITCLDKLEAEFNLVMHDAEFQVCHHFISIVSIFVSRFERKYFLFYYFFFFYILL
ncbi:hypothetical protein CsSME_00032503 [Camellia sinensis var. sinensis]